MAEAAALGPPPHFVCPIGLDTFRDPVVAADGITYERVHITTWLQANNTSPTTNLPLADRSLRPNMQLRQALQWWHGEALLRIDDPSRVVVHDTEILGTGPHSVAYGATLDGGPVVVKVYDTDKLFDSELSQIRNATRIGAHVASIRGQMVKDRRLCLVMKRYKESLLQRVSGASDRRLCVSEVLHVGRLLFAALAELDDAGIVPSSLKLSNLLLDDHGHLFIADLGIAEVLVAQSSTLCSARADSAETSRCRPPEAFDCEKFNGVSGKSAVWAAACVLLHLISGCPPFAALSEMDVVHAVSVCLKDPYTDALETRGAVLNALIPPGLHDFLCACFAIHQRERPSARDACALLAQVAVMEGRLAAQARAARGAGEQPAPALALALELNQARADMAALRQRVSDLQQTASEAASKTGASTATAAMIPDTPARTGGVQTRTDAPQSHNGQLSSVAANPRTQSRRAPTAAAAITGGLDVLFGETVSGLRCVQLSGSLMPVLNGRYVPHGALSNGRPQFRKTDKSGAHFLKDNVCITFDGCAAWVVSAHGTDRLYNDTCPSSKCPPPHGWRNCGDGLTVPVSVNPS